LNGLKTKMTIADWDLDTDKKEIAEHLKEFHSVNFNDRSALNDEEFKEEHFPVLLKHLEDKKNGYLSEKAKKDLNSIDEKIRLALKYCEEKGVAVIRVCDFDTKTGEIEWRICMPTREQIEYLKFKRWFAIIEGLANKTLLQGNLIDEVSLKQVLREIQDTIIQKQKKRQEIIVKQKVKNESKENH